MKPTILTLLCLIAGLIIPGRVVSQTVETYDLNALLQEKKVSIHNRKATSLTDGKYNGIKLNEVENDGVVWLNNLNFSNGTIEVDLKGKDVLQQSFLGVAFHGSDNFTYEAIYFRPFNFQAQDTTRRNHAVQYISQPLYTWKKLREDHYSVYENPIDPAPNPNEWFHARIEVSESKVSVFVNNAPRPSLEVSRLSNVKDGKLGLWVGNNSGGDFANLSIQRSK